MSFTSLVCLFFEEFNPEGKGDNVVKCNKCDFQMTYKQAEKLLVHIIDTHYEEVKTIQREKDDEYWMELESMLE